MLAVTLLLALVILIIWAAPTPTSRGTPAGIMLNDGYQALVTISSLTTVSFWEKTVKPPGIDGGDPIDITTMHNADWRTRVPRSLMTLTDSTGKAAYDPNVYNQLLTVVNVNATITVRWADGSTLAFYGFLRMLEFDDLAEGVQPELSYTITPTNYDPSAKVEASPVLTSVAGT